MTPIRRARFPEDLDAVKAIFREYIGSASVSLDFQHYEDELANLPGKYAAPGGGLFLAWQGDRVVGCAAFREVDSATCEMKLHRSPTRDVQSGAGHPFSRYGFVGRSLKITNDIA